MNNNKYKSLKGMPDILPDSANNMYLVESIFRKVFDVFGYKELKTPFLELTDVFTRSIGEGTDIVDKEIYSFMDRGGKNISLRPEGTASIVRSYIEHNYYQQNDIVKFFYYGPMFRGERPQKGRLRQFYQVGVEIIGSKNPLIDVELIFNLDVLLKKISLKDFTIFINSLGCEKDRLKYKNDLKTFLFGEKEKLCDNCKRRIGTNVLRVLDCKKESCKDIVVKAPNILEYLCDICKNNYIFLKNILIEKKINFQEKKDLVRGLDYYTGIVFEVTHSMLGSQDAIAAGGRYDNLSKQMGGPDVGAVGYAIGIERILMLIENKAKKDSRILILSMDKEYILYSFNLASFLWNKNIKCDVDYSEKSLKNGLKKANKEKREFVIILGENEIKMEKVCLKNMITGEQLLLKKEELLDYVKKDK